MIENIFNSLSPFGVSNQINYTQQIEFDIYEIARRKMQRDFEETDLKIKNSKLRKELGFWVDAKIKRRLLTQFGLLVFTRTRYKYFDKETKKWKHCYLADPLLQIQKHSKWSYSLKAEVIKLVAPGTSKQKDIINCFKFAPIHKSTLSRFIKKIDVQDLNEVCEFVDYKVPSDCKNYDRVHISIDDSFAKFKVDRKGVKHCIRLITLYLDTLPKPENRSKLKHKRILYEIKESKSKFKFISTKKLAEKLNKAIVNFYGSKDWNIVIEGDGADWIKNLASEMNAEIVLDKFHLFHKLAKIFLAGKAPEENKTAYKELETFLKESKIKDAISYLKECKNNEFKTKKEAIKKLIGYIKKNAKGIEAYQKDWYKGCFTESNIYHFIKSITNGKSFGLKYFLNLINLRLASTNTLDPVTLWECQIEYNIVEEAINAQEKKIPPKQVTKNVKFPILNNPRGTNFLEWLKNIIMH